jgi:hypothetical protein
MLFEKIKGQKEVVRQERDNFYLTLAIYIALPLIWQFYDIYFLMILHVLIGWIVLNMKFQSFRESKRELDATLGASYLIFCQYLNLIPRELEYWNNLIRENYAYNKASPRSKR